MPDRKEYELTEAELARLLAATRPMPVMYGNGGTHLFPSPQENSNAVWKALGADHGFSWLTVQPVPGKDQHFFTALPFEDWRP